MDEAGAEGETTWYVDSDRDGDGDPAAPLLACAAPLGAVATAEDCDDAEPLVSGLIVETAYDGLDNDCDPATLDDDLDGDGYELALDCDDGRAEVSPAEVEVSYDGLDNDCDPATLDDDLDGDGYELALDCDDGSAADHPGASETCDDEVDNDCDGSTDEHCPVTVRTTTLVVSSTWTTDQIIDAAVACSVSAVASGISSGMAARYSFTTADLPVFAYEDNITYDICHTEIVGGVSTEVCTSAGAMSFTWEHADCAD